jgi:hypothetical protein
MFLKSSLLPAMDVRTNKQHQMREPIMRDIKAILTRNSDVLLQDALGAVSLCVSFAVALYLPGIF